MRLIFKNFRRAIHDYPRNFLLSFFIVLLLTIINILIPYLTKLFLDQTVVLNNIGFLVSGVLVFAGVLMLKIWINIRWYLSLDDFGGKYINDLSLNIEKSLSECLLSDIDDIKQEIIKHIMYSDVLNVFVIIGHDLPSLIGAVTVIFGSLLLSLTYSVNITLFIMSAVALGFVISYFSRKIIANVAGETNKKLKQHHALCNEFVDLLDMIQTNNIIDYYKKRTKISLAEFIETSKEEDKKVYFWYGLIQNYNTLFSIALSAILALPSSGGSIVNLVFFTLLANIIIDQTQMAEEYIQKLIKSYVSFANVNKLLDLRPRQNKVELKAINEIIFKNVDFSYDNDHTVLLNISCVILKGSSIRLVGENGSGKSSFIKLILGMYRPLKGNIMFNGRDIRDFSQSDLNNEILYINQDEKLLNENIDDYLSIIADTSINSSEIQDLLDQVKLDDTRIENNGLSLSVGQRKQLLYLKLLLRYTRASVIILDELAAGLDIVSKKRYFEFIAKLMKEHNKIVIVIEHELNSDLKFDRVFKFNGGTLEATD